MLSLVNTLGSKGGMGALPEACHLSIAASKPLKPYSRAASIVAFGPPSPRHRFLTSPTHLHLSCSTAMCCCLSKMQIPPPTTYATSPQVPTPTLPCCSHMPLPPHPAISWRRTHVYCRGVVIGSNHGDGLTHAVLRPQRPQRHTFRGGGAGTSIHHILWLR